MATPTEIEVYAEVRRDEAPEDPLAPEWTLAVVARHPDFTATFKIQTPYLLPEESWRSLARGEVIQMVCQEARGVGLIQNAGDGFIEFLVVSNDYEREVETRLRLRAGAVAGALTRAFSDMARQGFSFEVPRR